MQDSKVDSNIMQTHACARLAYEVMNAHARTWALDKMFL